MVKAARVRTGTAGWVFEPWRGLFYPEGLKQKEELAFASAVHGAIEINATFYSHQKPASFRNWASQTPDDFMFTVKGHQFVTHIKKLKDAEVPVANFLASGVLALGPKLGPIVWQLPGNLKYDAERMENFLSLLPHTSEAASALAKKHDERLKEPAFTDATGVTSIRHAIEVRHESFAEPEFIAQLRRHNVALVAADTAEWPTLDVTADFVYCRLQGAPGKERYEKADLDRWAKRVGAWAKGEVMDDGSFVVAPAGKQKPREVFAFFVSTDKEHAPANAQALARRPG